MYKTVLFAAGIALAWQYSAASPALAAGKAWKCSAKGLVSSSYSGGSTAYIHLSGYSRGNNYPVTKKGNVASGVTKNGTKFTCKLS